MRLQSAGNTRTSWRHARRLALLGLVALLAGCAAGRVVMIQPRDLPVSYPCGPFTIQPDTFFADGFAVMYFVLPLLPLTSASTTASSLELAVTVQGQGEPFPDLGVADVQVTVPGMATPVPPAQVTVAARAAGPGAALRKTFRFTFDIDRHRLSGFTLEFPRPVNGCTLPATPYVRQVQRFYATPVNK